MCCGEHAGQYEVDEYSRVTVTASDSAQLCDLATKLTAGLTSISSSSHLHDLVTVTGLSLIIVDVVIT